MHCVVAVLHEHATPIAELHGQSHASARTQTIHVLAALLPRRNVSSATVPGQDLAFFKVDVDRVVPSAAAVLQGPDFARAEGRSCGETTEAGIHHRAAIRGYSPRASLTAGASGEGRWIIRGERLRSAAA